MTTIELEDGSVIEIDFSISIENVVIDVDPMDLLY